MIRVVVFIIAFGVCIDAVWASDERSIKKLRDAFVALAPDVDPGEAELVSVTAHTATRSLAREYRFVKGFQTFLINIGKRQRGCCADFTRDIGKRLKELRLKTLVLHWGAAYANTPAENNCLVVTARNQPFDEGIILDGWRTAPQLYWFPLKKDVAYSRFYVRRQGHGQQPGMGRTPALHRLVAGLQKRFQMAMAIDSADSAITCPGARASRGATHRTHAT